MPAASALRVLVVDDQLTIRSLVRAGLVAAGVSNVTDAPDGEEALKIMTTKPINLVISDFNMPKLDGLQFLRAIRACEPIKATAFIMLTGRADKDLVARAVQFGVNNYLVEPFSNAQLKEKIEGVFGPLT